MSTLLSVGNPHYLYLGLEVETVRNRYTGIRLGVKRHSESRGRHFTFIITVDVLTTVLTYSFVYES